MGFLDKLFGRRDESEDQRRMQQTPRYDYGGYKTPGTGYDRPGQQPQGQHTDEQAVERYRYMLRTAPPETIEQAHAEAFSQLTPEQRQMVLQQLSSTLPEQERRAGVRYGNDPQSLARLATRTEMRQPGTLERTFSTMPGMSMGGLLAGSFLSSIAGVFIGSAIANAFFGDQGYDQGYAEGSQAGEQDQGMGDTGQGQDAGYQEADMGGDYDAGGFDGGDFGGDFGGGDF
jgi:hypothetical protein